MGRFSLNDKLYHHQPQSALFSFPFLSFPFPFLPRAFGGFPFLSFPLSFPFLSSPFLPFPFLSLVVGGSLSFPFFVLFCSLPVVDFSEYLFHRSFIRVKYSVLCIYLVRHEKGAL